MKIEMLLALIIIVVLGLVYYGSEDIDPKVQAEFDYRYQN